MNKDMRKDDLCLSGQKSEKETGTLFPLRYDCDQLPQPVSKARKQSANKRSKAEKIVAAEIKRPKRLSDSVAEINMEFWDTDFENQTDFVSSYGLRVMVQQ